MECALTAPWAVSLWLNMAWEWNAHPKRVSLLLKHLQPHVGEGLGLLQRTTKKINTVNPPKTQPTYWEIFSQETYLEAKRFLESISQWSVVVDEVLWNSNSILWWLICTRNKNEKCNKCADICRSIKNNRFFKLYWNSGSNYVYIIWPLPMLGGKHQWLRL